MSADDAASTERTQDLVEAQRFLDALAGPGQSFVFQWFADSKGCSVPAAHVFSTLDNVDHRLVNLNESGCGIFVTVNESDGGRKKEDITHVRAVFVDLDGSPLQPILEAELKPHIIIESSPGRWHAYWLVTDDFPLNRFRDCQQGLANRFNGDASVCDLPRVLRLPGFTHRKKDPFVTRIHRMENELPRYSSDEILEWACPGGARPASVSQLQLKPAIQAPIAVANHQTRYAVHILKEEAKTVTSAAAGHRNNELNRAAFKLGSYIAAGLLALPEVEKALRDAGREAGLEHAEIQGTLQSGLAAGAQDPINLTELNYQASAFEVVQELNAKHAAVMVGGKFAVMNLEDSDEIFTFSRKTDLFDRHAKDLLPQLMRPSAAKPPTKAQVWWQSPLRRQYNGVIFAPGKPQGANDKFNLWRGFAIAPKAGKSELYWTLVRKSICGDDDKVYSYVRKYLAHMIQRPGDLPGIAIVLRSGQGTGKNTFVKPFIKILGRAHYIEITSTEHLVGRFNSHLGNKILVFANEASWGGDRKADGRLKAMITDSEESIERKHFDLTTESNFKRVIFASNADWVVPMDLDDRRFLVLEVSDCYQGDTEHWTQLHEELESGGYAAILHDLLSESLEGFNITDRPVTPATQRAALEQKMQRWDPTTHFWYAALQDGRIPILSGPFDAHYDLFSRPTRPEWQTLCETQKLHRAYRYWCEKNGQRHPHTDATFFRRLRELCPQLADTRPAAEKGQPRPRCLVFPSLNECRKLFEKAVGAPIDWASGDDEVMDEKSSASQSIDGGYRAHPSTESESLPHTPDTGKETD